MLLINRLKSKIPNTNHCRTPEGRVKGDEKAPKTLTEECMRGRQLRNQQEARMPRIYKVKQNVE